MPAISASYTDLISLIGKKVSREEVTEALLRLGAELKDIDEKEEAAIDVLANRPDMFSIEGIARAVKPFLDDKSSGMVSYFAEKSDIVLDVHESVTSVRPYIAGAAVRNVTMDDYLIKSLMDIQEKLHLTIGRRRRKVSIGVHDSRDIAPPFVYKAVEPKSARFVPLGMETEMDLNEILDKHEKGIEYKYILEGKDKYPLLVDSRNKVLSFPPIINGTITRVTPETENLFIDVTGTDAGAINTALIVLCTSLADRGGKVESISVRYNNMETTTPDLAPKAKTVTPEYVNSVLGISLSGGEMAKCLRLLRHDASYENNMLDVKIPCYRSDILHAVDITEDIAIGYGYQNINPVLPQSHTFGKSREAAKFSGKIEMLMVGHGFTETFTPTLSSESEQYAKMNLEPGERAEIRNPISLEQTCMRVSMLPSLLNVLAANKHRDLPQNLFEIGDVVIGGKNRKMLGIVIMHSRAGFTECKSVVDGVLGFVKEKHSVAPMKHSSFIDGRCAKVLHGDKEIGCFGELSLAVSKDSFGLDYPVAAAELDVEALMK